MGTESYTIGRGKLLFKIDGSAAYRDLGNCTDFKLTIGSEKKEHYSSRSGLQAKDLEVLVRQTASGSFTLDEMTAENIQLFIMGTSVTTVTQTSGTLTDHEITAVLNMWTNLGKTKISNVVVKNQAGTTTYVENTDYILDTKAGLIMPIGSNIVAGQTLKVTCDYAADSYKKIGAATATTVKGHIHFIGNPASGAIIDVLGYCAITPNGDIGLISDDWAAISFNMEMLSHQDYTGNFEIRHRGNV